MTRPNFFIVGAPKCGTTSMYSYLRSHPQVFMPLEKEPHYFAADLPKYRRMNTEEMYLRIFSGASSEHTAVGEASTWYLFSDIALSNIKAFDPDARIIVLFRNPVEFVQSLHSQFAFNANKKPNFAAAWEESRSRVRLISSGMFGQQFRRLGEIFSIRQVLVILQDDLRDDPKREYIRALSFLGLGDDGRSTFGVHNVHKIHRSRWITRFARYTPGVLENTWRQVKQFTGISGIGLMEQVLRLNEKSMKRNAISSDLRASVLESFSEDIRLLSRLLGRDLSHWR